nr:MAG TPA: hypothetical protein [Caudoviricetes sp.]
MTITYLLSFFFLFLPTFLGLPLFDFFITSSLFLGLPLFLFIIILLLFSYLISLQLGLISTYPPNPTLFPSIFVLYYLYCLLVYILVYLSAKSSFALLFSSSLLYKD